MRKQSSPINRGPAKPPWLRVRLGHGPEFNRTEAIIRKNRLHTVCEEALCPNRGECWCNGHATVMILGEKCTRSCRFCNVEDAGPSGSTDCSEPARVAAAVREAALKEVVITSVTRDDLEDGGAGIWAQTLREVRRAAPGIIIEVLVPDFAGSMSASETVMAEKPDVFGHNIETVPRLYPFIREKADYRRSLKLLQAAAGMGLITKTSLMLGLGETDEEIRQVMKDAVACGVSILFLGQYLQPSSRHYPVAEYLPPDKFECLRKAAFDAGFKVAVSSPLVRSSYHSDDQTQYVRKTLGTASR